MAAPPQTRRILSGEMELVRVDILVVAAIAAMAPVLADLSRRAAVPVVVAEIALGMSARRCSTSPHTDDFISALSTFGLAFLFFLAGMEIDFERIRGAPFNRGIQGWAMSLVLGAVIALILHATG